MTLADFLKKDPRKHPISQTRRPWLPRGSGLESRTCPRSEDPESPHPSLASESRNKRGSPSPNSEPGCPSALYATPAPGSCRSRPVRCVWALPRPPPPGGVDAAPPPLRTPPLGLFAAPVISALGSCPMAGASNPPRNRRSRPRRPHSPLPTRVRPARPFPLCSSPVSSGQKGSLWFLPLSLILLSLIEVQYWVTLSHSSRHLSKGWSLKAFTVCKYRIFNNTGSNLMFSELNYWIRLKIRPPGRI